MKERVDCFLGDYAGYTDAPVERAAELIQDLLAENQALTENLASMQETNRALVRRLRDMPDYPMSDGVLQYGRTLPPLAFDSTVYTDIQSNNGKTAEAALQQAEKEV